MVSPSNAVGQVFFLTENSRRYSKKNSVKFSVRGGKSDYKVYLPASALLSKLRIDPINKQGEIAFSELSAWKVSSFSRTKYSSAFSADNLSDLKQIEKITRIRDDYIVFSSVGKDPSFVIDKLAKDGEHEEYQPFLLIVIGTVMFLVITIIRAMRAGLSEQDQNKWCISFIVFIFLLLKMTYYNDNVAFGVPPDERAHYQYAMHLESEGLLIPDFGNMMIDGVKNNNYLSHSPLYYHMGNILFTNKSVAAWRTFNNYLILLSFFLVLVVVHKYYRLDFFQHLFIITAFSSLPMLAFIGASINNDGLGILSGGLFFFGVHSYFLDKQYRRGANTIVLALFLAYFSKLTVFLLVSFSFIGLLAQFKMRCYKIFVSTYIYAVFVALFIISYQVFIINKYGAIIPSLKVTNPDAYYHFGFFVPEDLRISFTPVEWFFRMLQCFWESYFNIYAHVSLVKPLDWISYIIIFTHVAGFGILFYPADKGSEKILKSMLYAIIVVVMIQYGWSYVGRQSSGYTGGLQARYYLPFSMVLPFSASIVLSRLIKHRIRNLIYLLLVMCLIYGDFIYFMLHTTEQLRFL